MAKFMRMVPLRAVKILSIQIAVFLSATVSSALPLQGSQPPFVSDDILDYLKDSGAQCHIPEVHQKRMLESLGVERTSVGPVMQQPICGRPYPKVEGNVDTDPHHLGAYCVLSFDTFRVACETEVPTVPDLTVPSSSSVTVEDVCGMIQSWASNKSHQYGEKCMDTCSGQAESGMKHEVNNWCYNLYYGRKVLKAMELHKNGNIPDAGGVSKVSAPDSTSVTSAGQRPYSTAQVPLSATAAPLSLLLDAESMQSKVMEQYNITTDMGGHLDNEGSSPGTTSTAAAIVAPDVVPSSGDRAQMSPPNSAAAVSSHLSSPSSGSSASVSSAAAVSSYLSSPSSGSSASVSSAAARSPAPPPRPPQPTVSRVAGKGMKPGVILSESSPSKVAGSDGASEAQSVASSPGHAAGGEGEHDEAKSQPSTGDHQPASGGDISEAITPDTSAAHLDTSAANPDTSAANPDTSAANPDTSAANPDQSNPSAQKPGLPAEVHGPPSGSSMVTSATSTSRRPPLSADEIPPPPVSGSASQVAAPAADGGGQVAAPASSSAVPPVVDVSSVGARPASAAAANVASAAAANVAPQTGGGDSEKLPAGQQVIPDQDVDYEDIAPAADGVTRQRRPQQPISASADDDDDFSLVEPRQQYKAPSGLQSEDELSGVSILKPLPQQGGSQSSFFAYSLTLMVLVIVIYLVFHNKKKIMALLIEGRNTSGRRRPHSSQYRKLDSSLEEAITSQQRQQVASNVIY